MSPSCRRDWAFAAAIVEHSTACADALAKNIRMMTDYYRRPHTRHSAFIRDALPKLYGTRLVVFRDKQMPSGAKGCCQTPSRQHPKINLINFASGCQNKVVSLVHGRHVNRLDGREGGRAAYRAAVMLPHSGNHRIQKFAADISEPP